MIITLADLAPSFCSMADADATGMTGLDFTAGLTDESDPAPKRELVFLLYVFAWGTGSTVQSSARNLG